MARCDLIIRNANIIDGSNAPRYRGDVAIERDRIIAIGNIAPDIEAHEVIDASGLALAPGFIDVHTHDDRALVSSPDMSMKVSQGVTTVVAGNCGISLAPFIASERPVPPMDLLGDQTWFRYPHFADYLSALDQKPPAVNGVFLIGHQTLRAGALTALDRPATESEIAVMRGHVEEAMRAGASGVSTGLFYPPARAAPTDEVVAVAEAARPFGGIYATHLRNESEKLEDSVEEALEIGERSGLSVVLSHHKAMGVQNHGKVHRTLARIEEAARSRPVSLDVYPYAASSTMLLKERIDAAERVLVTWSESMPEASGRDLAEIAAEHGVSPHDMVDRLLPAGAIYFAISEDDVQTVLRYRGAMIGSDGLPHDPFPHPRLWGSFPRVLGHYSRDLGLMPLEEAVYRMTGLPARVFNLSDRGQIKEGAFADLVLFDPMTVIDRASFTKPMEPAGGISLVMVNGQPVWRDGAACPARTGRVLRHSPAN